MPPTDARSNSPRWLLTAGRRILVWWPLKMTGTVAGMVVFFVAYFWLLEHPMRAVTLMPFTALDRVIGVHAWALPLYLSLWVYVSLAPALIVDRLELIFLGWGWVALSVLGLGIFLAWPTAVPVGEVDWSRYPALELLKARDAAGNACPSLHVAFAVFSAASLDRSLRQLGAGVRARGFNALWCLGILYSTIATRQHVVVDVAAGTALGAVVAAGYAKAVGRHL